MEYNDLYPKFEQVFLELVCLLARKVPSSLLEDMDFFIAEPYMSATYRTNTNLAYRIGIETEKSKDFDVIALNGLYVLFLARDSMIKGCPVLNVQKLLYDAEQFIKTYKLSESLRLNYG